MTPSPELWTSGFVILALGAIAGLIAGLLLTRRDAGKTDPVSDLDDAEQREQHRVALLRDLEEQKSKLAPETYAAQKAEYERLAATALRERERLAAALARQRKPPDAAPSVWTRHPQLRGVAWGAATVAVAWFIYASASDSAQPNPPAAPTSGQAAETPELAAVRQQLQANPADLAALVRGGGLLVRAARFDEAAPYLERALQLDPEHPDALTQWAALRAARGDQEGAARTLDQIVAKHPDALEAWSLRGMLALKRGDRAQAEASFAEFVARSPDGPPKERVKALLNETPAAEESLQLWQTKCAGCHGEAGRGDPAAGTPDLTATDWQAGVTDDRLRQSIRAGKADDMPAFGSLAPAQIDRLVELIRSWRTR